MSQVLIVGFGGFIGTVVRYLLHTYCIKSLSTYITYPTAWINILGSLLMGVFLGFGVHRFSENVSIFLITGFLGGFTTYSAFSGETLNLLRQEFYLSAIGYVSLTLVGGLLMVGLGFYLAKYFLNS